MKCGTKPIPGGAGWGGAWGTWSVGFLPRPWGLWPSAEPIVRNKPNFGGRRARTHDLRRAKHAKQSQTGAGWGIWGQYVGHLCKTNPISTCPAAGRTPIVRNKANFPGGTGRGEASGPWDEGQMRQTNPISVGRDARRAIVRNKPNFRVLDMYKQTQFLSGGTGGTNKANSLGWDRGVRARATGDGPLPGAAKRTQFAARHPGPRWSIAQNEPNLDLSRCQPYTGRTKQSQFPGRHRTGRSQRTVGRGANAPNEPNLDTRRGPTRAHYAKRTQFTTFGIPRRSNREKTCETNPIWYDANQG